MLIPNHPDDERLSALASRDTDAIADAGLTTHVASCIRCTELVDELGALRLALADLPDLQPSRPLQLVPPVEADHAVDRLGGWARRFFAPVLVSGAALVLVGVIGTASPAFSGMAQSGAVAAAGGCRRELEPERDSAASEPAATRALVSASDSAAAPERMPVAKLPSSEARTKPPMRSRRSSRTAAWLQWMPERIARRRPRLRRSRGRPLAVADGPLRRRRPHRRGAAHALDPRTAVRLTRRIAGDRGSRTVQIHTRCALRAFGHREPSKFTPGDRQSPNLTVRGHFGRITLTPCEFGPFAHVRTQKLRRPATTAPSSSTRITAPASTAAQPESRKLGSGGAGRGGRRVRGIGISPG